MDLMVWAAFAAASAAVLAAPGPTVLLVCAYAVTEGRRVGLAVTAGVAAGDLLAMTVSMLGLGALLLASATAFTVLKLIGAAYLIYLGWRMWRAPTSAPDEVGLGARPGGASAASAFGRAFAVTATNPKAIVFFVAFTPQFLEESRDLAPQMAIMIATFVIMAAGNAALYAVLADRLRRRITRPTTMSWVNRLGGGSLMAMGALTAAAQRS